MNFCSNCGSPVESKIPAGDHLPRFVCTSCNMVHYKNPLLVLGCVPEWQNKILLCRRAIEPRLGFWTVPAGFMENGETMQQAAARECQEEALAEVEVGSLLAVVNVTRANQVHVMFRAKLLEPKFAAGAGESGGCSIRRSTDPLDGVGICQRRICLAAILRRPQRGPRGPSFHRTEKPLHPVNRAGGVAVKFGGCGRIRFVTNRVREG